MKIKMVILLFFFLYSLLFVILRSFCVFLCVICVCSLHSIVYVLECACFVLWC